MLLPAFQYNYKLAPTDWAPGSEGIMKSYGVLQPWHFYTVKNNYKGIPKRQLNSQQQPTWIDLPQ